MESRRKRSRGQIVKWICYALLGLLCAVLQTTPGLFQFGTAKPLWLLPLALAVAVFEGEFAGAVFGAVCGLMWDWPGAPWACWRWSCCCSALPFRR